MKILSPLQVCLVLVLLLSLFVVGASAQTAPPASNSPADAKTVARLYRQAVKYDPNNADYVFNLGIAYLNLGDKPAAIQQHQILKTLNAELARQLYRAIY